MSAERKENPKKEISKRPQPRDFPRKKRNLRKKYRIRGGLVRGKRRRLFSLDGQGDQARKKRTLGTY